MANFVFVAKWQVEDSEGNEMKVASVLDDWKMAELKIETKEQHFGTVDNPGSWDDYSFCHKFKKEKGGLKKYEKDQLLSGCIPFPVNSEQKKDMDG